MERKNTHLRIYTIEFDCPPLSILSVSSSEKFVRSLANFATISLVARVVVLATLGGTCGTSAPPLGVGTGSRTANTMADNPVTKNWGITMKTLWMPYYIPM